MAAAFIEQWFTLESTSLPLPVVVSSHARQPLGQTNLTPMTMQSW
jgi:hypothetical protein